MPPDVFRSFQVLQLPPGASIEAIKGAYRRLAKQWHPDRFPSSSPHQSEAHERFREINVAYQRLIAFVEKEGGRAAGRQDQRQERHAAGGSGRPDTSGRYASSPGGDARASQQGFSSAGASSYAGRRSSPEVERLRALANQGYALAQNFLALKLYKGEGVIRDDELAKSYFRKAAFQGLAKAQYNLGVMYYFGHGGPRNFEEAARWFRRAAEQGFARANINLGVMYRNGYGVARDPAKAEEYFYRATHGRPPHWEWSLQRLRDILRAVISGRWGKRAQLIGVGLVGLFGLVLTWGWYRLFLGNEGTPLAGRLPWEDPIASGAWAWALWLAGMAVALPVAVVVMRRYCGARSRRGWF